MVTSYSAVPRDFSGALPLYHQVRIFLEEMVCSGQFRPGDKFPTEEELAKRFGVSRPTINKAVNLLVERGFLVRERGKGTFVARRKEVRLLLMEQLSFSESVEDALPFRTEVIKTAETTGDKDVVSRLGLNEGERVVALRRIRYIEDEPIAAVDSYLPMKLFPGIEKIDFRSHGLYQILDSEYGMPVTYAERFLRCTRIYDHEIADLLGINPLDPVLDLEGIAYSGSVRVEYYRATLRDSVVLHSRISRRLVEMQRAEELRLSSLQSSHKK